MGQGVAVVRDLDIRLVHMFLLGSAAVVERGSSHRNWTSSTFLLRVVLVCNNPLNNRRRDMAVLVPRRRVVAALVVLVLGVE